MGKFLAKKKICLRRMKNIHNKKVLVLECQRYMNFEPKFQSTNNRNGVIEIFSYERRAYESVDDRSLS